MLETHQDQYVAEVDLSLADLQALLDLLDAAERMSLVVSGIHHDGKLSDLRATLHETYHGLLERNYGDVLINERIQPGKKPAGKNAHRT